MAELKNHDAERFDATLQNNAAMTGMMLDPLTPVVGPQLCLNAISQGTGFSERIGLRIRAHRLVVRGVLRTLQTNFPSGSPPTDFIVFLAIVLDMNTNGAQCVSEDIFNNVSSLSVYTAVNPFTKRRNRSRFVVLATSKIRFPCRAFNSGELGTWNVPGRIKTFEFDIPLSNIEINYSGEFNQITNIVDRSLHIVGSTASLNTNPEVRLDYGARLYFTDF